MVKFTDIENDLQIIEDFFTDEDDYENSLIQMCKKMDISPDDYIGIKYGNVIATKEQLAG